MSDGIEVSYAELDAIVSRFQMGLEDLGNARRRAPTGSPAGLGGATAASVVSHLLRSAAALCEGIEAAAAGVRQTREDYSAIDEAVAVRGHRMTEPL